MPTIELTRQAYEIITQRANETKRSPGDVASEIITAEAEAKPHPYVEQRKGVLGGKPVVKGSRLPVWQIAVRLQLGDSPDEILDDYPQLSAAALYDAISYYFDHRAEIERQIEENQLENTLARHNAVLDEQGRISFRDLPTHA